MSDPTIAAAINTLLQAGFMVLPPQTAKPDLKPMATHENICVPQYHRVSIEIGNANHFIRTYHFAESNALTGELGKRLLSLLSLFCQSRGSAIPRKSWERLDAPQQYEPGKAFLYPDGYTDPSFGWQGAGLVGGLIFHRSSRDWSIHT